MAIGIATNDILIARAWVKLDEQAAVNTYAYRCITVTGGGVTDQDFATFISLDLGMAAFYRALLTPASEFRGIQAYFVNRGVGVFLPAPVKAIGQAGVGTTTGDPVPRNACGILKYNTVVRGPGGRGRVYLPYMAQSYVGSNGQVNAAFGTLVNSLASNMLPPIVVVNGGSSATLTWCLLHKTPGQLPTSTGEIVSAEAGEKIGQMHKRGDYGRANASPI